VVTGGSSGLGLAAARQLAAEGFAVVLVACTGVGTGMASEQTAPSRKPVVGIEGIEDLAGTGQVQAFASMIETAVELTEGRIVGHDIQTIIDIAREMLSADLELLEHTLGTVAQLASTYALMVITKGDLLDQEQKIARSGLSAYFRHIEIVSDKTPASYAAVLKRYSIAPERFLMVGNSLRSDILPVARSANRPGKP